MNADQSGTLLNFIEDTASGFDYFNFPLRKAAAQLKSDIDSMHQPITPGALVDAGWVRDEAWMPGWYSISLADDQTLDICIDGRLRFVINDPGDAFWFAVSNMYDLAELVRLLGGKA